MEVWAGGLKVIIGMILRFEDKRPAFLNRSGRSSEIRMGKKYFFNNKNNAISTAQIQKQKKKSRPRPLSSRRQNSPAPRHPQIF